MRISFEGEASHRSTHRHLRGVPWHRWTHKPLGHPDFWGHLSVPRGTREGSSLKGGFMGSPPQWEEWSQRAPQPASCLFARVAPTPRPPHRLVNGSRQSRIRRNPSGSLQYEIIQEVLGYQWAKRGRGGGGLSAA